jgi:hypothetical protein
MTPIRKKSGSKKQAGAIMPGAAGYSVRQEFN